MQTKHGMVFNTLALTLVFSGVLALAGDTTPVGQVGKVVNLRADLPKSVVAFAPTDAKAIRFTATLKDKSVPADLVVHWNTFKYKKSTFLLSYWVTVKTAYPNIELSQPYNDNSINRGTEESVIQGIRIFIKWQDQKLVKSRFGTVWAEIQADGKFKVQ